MTGRVFLQSIKFIAVCNYRKKSLRSRKVHTMNFWDDDAVKILLFSNYGSLDLDMYVVDQN